MPNSPHIDPLFEVSSFLKILDDFKKNCPGVLLGMDGNHLLERIIDDLTILEKIPFNVNETNQYKIWTNVAIHVDHLKTLVDEHSLPPLDELQRLYTEEQNNRGIDFNKFIEENYPYSQEFKIFSELKYYDNLSMMEERILLLQETNYPHLHSAHHLMLSLEELQQFDPEPNGALSQLLHSLNNTFEDQTISADKKLATMIQEVQTAYHAIRTSPFGSPMTFFGVVKINPSRSHLGDAVEIFIRQDLTKLAELNGLPPPNIGKEAMNGQSLNNRNH